MKIKHLKTGKTDYWVYNDDKKLPVLVMVHGLRGTHHGLDLAAKELDNFEVIVPDLPGFGESIPLDDKHSIENYVKWLKEFIDSLDLKEKPFLLGHSFGSIITSHFAKEYPDAISRLILVNPIGAPALKGPRSIMSRLAVMYYWLGKILPDPFGTKLLKSKLVVIGMTTGLAKTRNKVLRKFIHSQHLQHFNSFQNKKVVSEAFIASVTNNVRDVASSIKVPTLIIAGDIDDITPIKMQHELVKLFPDAKIREIKGVGHLTHYEKPEIIVEEINAFLS